MAHAIGLLLVLILDLLFSSVMAADGGRTLAVRPTAQERRFALVIGNDSYQHIGPLRNARADARAIAKGLENAGFTVTLKQDLAEKSMKEALRAFKAQLSGGDVAIFFFAGHGVQLGAANYLLPTDIRGDNEEQVKDEAIALQRVLDDLQEQKTKFSLAIIDACRNNPFKTTGRAIGGRGLAPTTAATGQMVLFSAGVGQEALDRVGPNDRSANGLFTRVLLKEMERPGISADRVLRNVREEVVKVAKTVNHEQVPALYDQVVGDFYFRPPDATPVTLAPAARRSSDAELEQELWDGIKDSASAEPIEEYLRQYPSGRFVPNARVLLAKLKAAQVPVRPAAPPAQVALLQPSAPPASPTRPLAAADTSFPRQPVRIVVPYPPGGATDLVARVLTTRLSELGGQPFIVENRAGAGGTVGSQAVARAAPDGYTLLLGSTASHAVAPALYSNAGYNGERDFLPVAFLGESQMLLVAHPGLPVRSLQELLAYARANPGRLTYASSGAGSLSHLLGELFTARTGTSIIHVPYRGSGPAMQDLLGGQVNIMFSDISGAMTLLRGGKLRALAVASNARSAILPDVPTLAEAGLPGVAGSSWLGLFAPAGTLPAIVSRLSQLVDQTLRSAEVRERLNAANIAIASQPTPDRLAELLRVDGQQWTTVIRNAAIRVE